MYAYIKGVVAKKDELSLVVETNGIGYNIVAPLSTLEKVGGCGDEVKVHTHLHVREDAMILYGFYTIEERRVFQQLISVSGVGPKAALSILSNIPVSRFGLAVITDDVSLFTKAQGIGKKTAQRIILELKDKLKNEQVLDVPDSNELRNVQGDSKLQEAASALMMLGYSYVEANKAIAAVYNEEKELETVIRDALKSMVRSG